MIFLINPYITGTERYGRDIGNIGWHRKLLGIFYLAGNPGKRGESRPGHGGPG
ncbi:MAG: hypothetical protein P8130_09730 [Deltaproteobacteria bacterium]